MNAGGNSSRRNRVLSTDGAGFIGSHVRAEDFAVADIDRAGGEHLHLSRSWRASVECGSV
jgi:hypothetical protein